MESPRSAPKLRVGLLLGSRTVPAWLARTVERIASSGYAEIALVVMEGADLSDRRSSRRPREILGRLARRLSQLIYRLYIRSEEKRLRARTDAFEPTDLTPLIRDAAVLSVVPRRNPAPATLKPQDVDRIRAHELDVLLQLGMGDLHGDATRAAKRGIWTFRHGGSPMRHGGPAGFWEVFTGEPVTGAALHVLADTPEEELVLARTYSSTDPILVKQSLNSLYWKAVSLIPRQLRTLHELGHAGFDDKLLRQNKDPRFYSLPRFSFPKSGELLLLLARHFAKYLKRRLYNRLYFHQWILLFDFRDGMSSTFSRFKRILPPKDRFWADPCVVERDGKYHVFIEECVATLPRAHISVLTIDENGGHTAPVPVLQRPYHLSYPHVFSYRGVDYMVPETLENNAIELYRCERFPDNWVFERTLIPNIKAADVTLLEHAGKWWLFGNVIENEGASSWDELFLFYADSPIGSEWKPHPLNPIVSDVRRARPAGGLFRHNGELYRPGQDCAADYGSGIRIHRVTRLTETEYEEVEVDRIEPRWDRRLVGVHTLSWDGRLTVIDGNMRRGHYFD